MSERANRLPHLITWAAIAIAIVWMMFAGGGGWIGIYAVQWRLVSLAMIVLSLAVWLLVAARTHFWLPRSTLWPAFLLALTVFVLSLVTSWAPRLGADYLAYAFLLTCLYLLMQRLFAHPFFGPRLGQLSVVLCLAVCVLYLYAVGVQWVAYWAQLGRFAVPPLRPGFEGLSYGNPSAVATIAILLWLASVAQLGTAGRRHRAALVALSVIVAIVVFLTGSRGAWLGVAIAAVVLVPVWFADPAHRRSIAGLLKGRSTRIGIGALAIGGLALSVPFLPAVLSRLAEPAADTRLTFYQTAIRMFMQAPILGQGPGTWVARRISFTQTEEVDYYIPHAHNIFLQTLAEFGVVGMVAGVGIAVSLAWLIRDGARDPDPIRRRLGWASLAGLVYLAGHQLVDFYANMPAVMFALAMSVARLDALGSKMPPIHVSALSIRRGPPIARACLVIATALSVVWLSWSESISLAESDAVVAANDGDWGRALALLRSVAEADPGMPPYAFTLGLAASHTGDYATSLDAFERSASVDDFPEAWLDLAAVQARLGAVDDARQSLLRAMRLGYQQPTVAVAAADVYLELGDTTSGEAAIAAALLTAPSLASDPYFQSTRELRDVMEAAVAAALSRGDPSTALEVALEADDLTKARDLVSQQDSNRREVSHLVVEAWSGNRSAFERLHTLALDDPLNVRVVAWCRRVAAHTAEPGWIGGGRPWTCDGAGTPATYPIIRVGPPSPERVEIPGPDAPFYAQYTYRAVAPWDQLVPGLPHLTSTIP